MLPKCPLVPVWFNQFHTAGIWESYAWLLELGIRADKIANFGSWTGEEAIVLLWLFDASENTVVEIDESNINTLKKLEQEIRINSPERLQGRTINTIKADMSLPIPELPSNYFDLAFCENALYYLKMERVDFDSVQIAINQMARVIRPGGWVVAYEPKMNVKFEERDSIFPGLTLPIPVTDPTDISNLFETAGLLKPAHKSVSSLYIYCKPRSS